MFNLMGGLALLAASLVAGGLWDATGPQGTFLAGAALSGLALVGLVTVRGRISGHDPSGRDGTPA
jgi:hypothetical protein